MPKKTDDPTKAFEALSREEQLLAAVRANLKRYGTITPPEEELIQNQMKKCPKCGETKPVGTGFKIKKYWSRKKKAYVPRPQSWCNMCRGSKEAHPGRYGSPRSRERTLPKMTAAEWALFQNYERDPVKALTGPRRAEYLALVKRLAGERS